MGERHPLDSLLTENEELREWFRQYDALRAQAVHQVELLNVEHSALDEEADVIDPTPPSQVQDAALDHAMTTQVWKVCMPMAMATHFGPSKETEMVFSKDCEAIPYGMAEAMDILRDRIDTEFGWKGKILTETWQEKRAAVQAALLLMNACGDDGKSELLQTKLFTLILGERYRAHAEVLFHYVQGAWKQTTTGSISAPDLEFMSMALRKAQAYYFALGRNNVQREWNKIVWELRVVLALPTDGPLMDWQLCDVSPQKNDVKSRYWWLAQSELSREIRKVMADHCKTLVRSFLRWSESSMSKRKAGIAFQDCRELS